MNVKSVRIAGAGGYWGDSPSAPFRLVEEADFDYLVIDYLAEVTMSILARARSRNPQAGYATDFIDWIMRPLLGKFKEHGIKIIANAGGMNVEACRGELAKLAMEQGIDLRIGTVSGDDLMGQMQDLAKLDLHEIDTGAPMPTRLMSANAYLGAFPIAAALDAGAEVVITGRVADSALILGPLVHEFAWPADAYDLLAAGSLAGHLIECGAQVTGGNSTDWDEVAAGWADIGYPVVEVASDGTFVINKPQGTKGRVTPLTVAEQLLYEIGNPAAYLLPDVSCDFTGVELSTSGSGQVRVSGAKGRPPGPYHKVSATWMDGYSSVGAFAVVGERASERARRQAQAVLEKSRRGFFRLGWEDFSDTAIQVIGDEELYGKHARIDKTNTREVIMRVGIHHSRREGADYFARELVGSALSMSPGVVPLIPGRPRVSPIVRLFNFLVLRDRVQEKISVDAIPVPDTSHPMYSDTNGVGKKSPPIIQDESNVPNAATTVPLRNLAVARSGDKADTANIGVIARSPEYLPFIRAALTAEAVGEYFSHLVKGTVTRYEVPGIHGLNFVLKEALGGGGIGSLRLDPQGKTYAQLLLDCEIPIPESLLLETQSLREGATFNAG